MMNLCLSDLQLPSEEWKDIPGYEGLYQASTLGRIRTCEGKTTSSARFEKRVWKQRIMKQKLNKNRKGRIDARVCLWKDGKEKLGWFPVWLHLHGAKAIPKGLL